MTTAVSREREALMSDSKLTILGARVHNLKNVDVEIPRHSLTVITGLSGSGKSSLAFDTIYAEGQRLCPQFPGQHGAPRCGPDFRP